MYHKITIEMFIKTMRTKGITKGKAELDGIEMQIDLDSLYITFGREHIELYKIPGTKGGYRYFFICSSCGRKCRVLYKYILMYACGTCQQVHKKTLNRSKTDCQYYWERALREARKVQPDWSPERGGYMFDGFPSRPKRMKRTKYWKHYKRFMKYCNKGDRLWVR